MAVSYNGSTNKIYWECKKCGYSNNSASITELHECYLNCEKCGTLHEVDVNISVTEIELFTIIPSK